MIGCFRIGILRTARKSFASRIVIKYDNDSEFAKPCNAPMYSISLPTRNAYARPLLPARAVLPQRCENALGSMGGSNWTTTSTCGISSPLAATSVARSIDGELEDESEDEKAERARVRAAGSR